MSAEAVYLPLFIFLIVIFIFFYLLKAFLKFNRGKEKNRTEGYFACRICRGYIS